MKSKIISIAGDASFRKFYRIILNKKSKIIVISKKEKYNNLIAYEAVNKFLKKKKILTPKLFSHDYKKGIIIIEDFGNKSFYKLLLKEKNRLKIYKKLINLLIKIQKIKPQPRIKNLFKKYHLIEKYSHKHLHNESNLFFKWYLPLFLNRKKILVVKKKMKRILSELYKNLSLPNSYFVHRDFHCQNLIKVKNSIGVIDSQDALIGNPAYDLVSLIDDVRLKTSNDLKKKVYEYYVKKSPIIYKNNSEFFLKDFNILSVQRSLKIIGIFARLFKRDKKNKYLKLIPYTWKLLEMRMDSKIFLNLKKILDESVSKKIRRKVLNK